MTITTSYGRRRVVARRMLLAATTILAAGMITPALAQTAAPASPRSQIDGNGVDLFNGAINVAATRMVLGAGQSMLDYHQLTRGNGWTDTLTASIDTYYGGNTVTVMVGGASETFMVSGGAYTSQLSGGSTLTLDGGIYTYTASDGTVIHFNQAMAQAHPIYASGGKVVDITKPSGEKLTYSYESISYCAHNRYYTQNGCTAHQMAYRTAQVKNSAGYAITYGYDTDASDFDPDEPVSNESVDAMMTPSSVTGTNLVMSGGASATQSFGYADAGAETSFTVTDAMNRVTTYRMSGNQLLGITRPGSGSENVTIGYASGRVSSVTTATGSWTYSAPTDTAGTRTVSVTDPSNATTSYLFDIGSQALTGMTDALGHVWAWSYDANGQLTGATSPEGNAVAYGYDTRGNTTSTTLHAKLGSGQPDIMTSAGYDATCGNAVTCNQPNWTKDANGNQTGYTYDPTHGAVLTVTLPAPSGDAVRPQMRYSYSAYTDYLGSTAYRQTGTSTCRTQSSCGGTSDEVVTSTDYGSVSGNNLLPLSVTKRAGDNSLSATASTTYDGIGNMVTATDPTGAKTHFTYDADREPTGTISADPDGGGPLKPRAVRTTYNADGTTAQQEVGTDTGNNFASLQQVVIRYDGAQRKVRQTVTAGGTTYGVVDYGYDVANRITCVTQRMNPAAFGDQPGGCNLGTQGGNGPDRMTRTHVDQVGRVDSVTSAYGADAAATQTSSYTQDGKVESVTDAIGNTTQYSYDGFDRLVRTNYPNASGGGVDGNDYEQLALDNNGNVTARRLRDGSSISYGVDGLNRTTVAYLPGGNNAANPSLTFDNLGELTGATNGNGQFSTQTYFSWDALGRKTSETNAHNGVSKIEYVQYDLAGRRTFQLWDDGFVLHYDYDALGEMLDIHNDTDTFVSLSYDDLGRRTALNRGNGTSTSYGYDNASQLTALTLNGGNAANGYTFGYNPAGQITSRTASNDAFAFSSSSNASRSYTHDGLNRYSQVAGTTFGYDGRGNATATGGTPFSYDPLNELTGAGGTRLDYDALGRLVYDTASGLWQDHDGAEVTAEYDGSGKLLRRYVFGPGTDEPLVWFEGTGTSDRRYLHADERGSVVAVTNAGGSSLGINSYDEYGTPGASNIGRFQYTGQKWLAGLGLYDYKARMYAPSLGRFMQTDPIGYGDGINWYNYTGGDPVNAIDPTGLNYTATGFSGEKCTFSDSGAAISCPTDVVVTAGGGGGTIVYGPPPLFNFDLWPQQQPVAHLIDGSGGPPVGAGAPAQQNDILNHDIGADIVVVARKVPKPVQNFISDYVINYDCAFISSTNCSASDYVSAGLLLTGVGVAENTAIEGASKGFAKYGIGRAGQVRFFENRLIVRLDVNKPITHLNVEGNLFGVRFNFHLPRF